MSAPPLAPTATQPQRRSPARAGVIVPAILAVLLLAAITVAIMEFRRVRPAGSDVRDGALTDGHQPRRSRRCPPPPEPAQPPTTPAPPATVVIGANCTPSGSTGTTAEGATAYCSPLQPSGSDGVVVATGQHPEPDGDHRTDRCTAADRGRVADTVCMQQTGIDPAAMLGIHPAQQWSCGAMKFAVIAPVAAGSLADPAWMSAFARHVEACGFESIVAVEHTVLMTEYNSIYPYDASGRVELPADCRCPIPSTCLRSSQRRPIGSG